MLVEFLICMAVVVAILLPFFILSYYLNNDYKRVTVKVKSQTGNVVPFRRKR